MMSSSAVKWIVLLVALSFLSACADKKQEDNSAEALHYKAQEILVDNPGDAERREALKFANNAIDLDPEYEPALRTKVHLLVSLGRMQDALPASDKLSKLTGEATDKLYYCMLLERVDGWAKPVKACYEQVAARYADKSSQSDSSDRNYLLALKLSKSPRFQEQVAEIDKDSAGADKEAKWLVKWLQSTPRGKIVEQFTSNPEPSLPN